MKTLTRTEAARVTRVAQIGGIALAAVTVIAAARMGGPPPADLRDLPPAHSGEQPVDSAPAPPTARKPDLVGVAKRLAVGWTAPASAKPPPTPSGPPTPNSNASAWRYLGSVVEPTRTLALLSDGRQRFIAEGELIVDGIRLAEVHDGHVILNANGRPQRIDRAERFGTRLSSSAAPAINPNAPAPLSPTGVLQDAGREDIAAIMRQRQERAARARLQTNVEADGGTTTTMPPIPIPPNPAGGDSSEAAGLSPEDS